MAALGAIALLARPAIAMIGEERAAWATSFRVHQLLGLAAAPALALVALGLLAITARIAVRAAAPRPRRRRGRGAAAVAVLAVQDQAAWHQMTTTAKAFRTQMPDDLEWIDHQASGPVALLALTQNAPQYEDLELFNRRIAAVYVPPAGLPGRPVQGRTCTFRFTVTGALKVAPGCGAVPRRFMLDDPAAAITFRDERRSSPTRASAGWPSWRPGTAPRARVGARARVPARLAGVLVHLAGHRRRRCAAGAATRRRPAACGSTRRRRSRCATAAAAIRTWSPSRAARTRSHRAPT